MRRVRSPGLQPLESIEDEAVLRQLVKRVWTVRSMGEFEAQL